MKKAIVLLLGLFWVNFAFGTGQVPDYLILDKDTLALFSNPLEQYFEQIGKRELIDFDGGCGSTACWRGYKAIWELKNDSLFLRRIAACHEDCGNPKDANLIAMFGESMPFASWVDGDIIVPRGKLLEYIHMGYASIYEKEQIFTIKQGKLQKVKIKTNKEDAQRIYKQNQSKEFTILALDTIFQTIQANMDWEALEDSDYLCDDEYILTFNKQGEIKKVSMYFSTDEKTGDKWEIRNERYCGKKIKKALKALDLGYLNPKVEVDVYLEIFYDDEKGVLELWEPMWFKEWKEEQER